MPSCTLLLPALGSLARAGLQRLKLALDAAVAGAGLQSLDPAHHQPAGRVLALAAAGERGERHLGDLSIRDPPLLGLSKTALG